MMDTTSWYYPTQIPQFVSISISFNGKGLIYSMYNESLCTPSGYSSIHNDKIVCLKYWSSECLILDGTSIKFCSLLFDVQSYHFFTKTASHGY